MILCKHYFSFSKKENEHKIECLPQIFSNYLQTNIYKLFSNPSLRIKAFSGHFAPSVAVF